MKTCFSVLAGGMILLAAALGVRADEPTPAELTPEAVRALVEKLRSDRFDERSEAATRLDTEVVTTAQIDALAEFADDESLEVRQRVRKLLRAKGWIHPDDRPRVKAWLAALRSDDRDERCAAFEGLAGYDGPYADPFGDLLKVPARAPRLELKARSIVITKLVKVGEEWQLRGELKATSALRNWSREPMWIEDGALELESERGPLLPGANDDGPKLYRASRREEADGSTFRVLDGRKRFETTETLTFDAPGRYSVALTYRPRRQAVTVASRAVDVPLATSRTSRARTVVVLPPLKTGEAGPETEGFRLALRSEVLETEEGERRKIRVDLAIENRDEAERPFKGVVGGSWGGAWIAVLDDANRLYAHQRVLRRDKAIPKGADVARIAGGGRLERRFDLPLPLAKGSYRIIAGYSTKVADEQYAEMWSNVVTIAVE